ncbi:MAG: NYN domain-containing protein [Candidatus Methanomethylophilaceae archaeon]|nr:NYN domain-containing protein [Candidatus Methanomethylophilaceae archaeon]
MTTEIMPHVCDHTFENDAISGFKTTNSSRSTIPDVTDKVAIFMDFDNMYKGFRETVFGIRGVHIDLTEMDKLLANGRQVVVRRAYNGEVIGYNPHTVFQKAESAGYELATEMCDGYIQKGVDVRLALEMDDCSRDSNCDTILLISGDADFVPVVRRARKFGKKIQVASFKNCLSHSLEEAADVIIPLDRLRMLDVDPSILNGQTDESSEVKS